MVKVTAGRAEHALAEFGPEIRAVLLFGPEIGLIADRSKALIARMIADPTDPFAVVAMTGAQIASDPAKLPDEVQSPSLLGGQRVIRVTEVADAAKTALEALIALPRVDECLVILEAGELATKSPLRTMAERADSVLAVGCYAEDERQREGTIRAQLQAAGKRADPDATAYLAQVLAGDRMMLRSEITKLLLYLGDQPEVTLADARAAIADDASADLDALIFAVGAGDPVVADRALTKLLASGMNAIPILRSLARHFQRLQSVVRLRMKGQPLEAAMKSLWPPVFFKVQGAFRAQVDAWSDTALSAAIDRLWQAELACKRRASLPNAVCATTVHALTMASPLARRRRG